MFVKLNLDEAKVESTNSKDLLTFWYNLAWVIVGICIITGKCK